LVKSRCIDPHYTRIWHARPQRFDQCYTDKRLTVEMLEIRLKLPLIVLRVEQNVYIK